MRFWEEWWIGDKPLKTDLPRLYHACFDKTKSVAEILCRGLDQVQFRRMVYGDSLDLWNHIKEVCVDVVLADQKDFIRWTLTKNGGYSVKSYYRLLTEKRVKYPRNFLWKVKVPPRMKVFMWLIRNNILMKNSLARRGWIGDKKCPYCGKDESICRRVQTRHRGCGTPLFLVWCWGSKSYESPT